MFLFFLLVTSPFSRVLLLARVFHLTLFFVEAPPAALIFLTCVNSFSKGIRERQKHVCGWCGVCVKSGFLPACILCPSFFALLHHPLQPHHQTGLALLPTAILILISASITSKAVSLSLLCHVLHLHYSLLLLPT